MAMRKVGRNACGRMLVPMGYTSIVYTVWKLFSAGSPELFCLHWFLIAVSSVGWKLFSAGSPDMKYNFASGQDRCRNGLKLFSAYSPSVCALVFLVLIICLSGWKFFYASSPDIYSWLCVCIAHSSQIQRTLRSLLFYGKVLSILCIFGGSLPNLFHGLRQSRLSRRV